MEKNKFKNEKIFGNYSYRKKGIKNNQQTNILKTYNNINNEIIINIKNNEKYSTDKEKKYEVRRIRLKLPNELMKKNDTLDLINLNIRDTGHSINSSNQIMPNSLLYNQNIQNKKIKLEQLINEFSLRNKYDSSNNITNNTFQYMNDNIENDSVIKKSEKKEKQIPINSENKIKYYKKPLYGFGKMVYHKINNLSYRNKKQSTNSTNNKKLILENIKANSNFRKNQINNLTQRKESDSNNTEINIKKNSNSNILLNKFKYEKINPLLLKEKIRKNFVPINVNRNKKFYSNNASKIKEDESSNNIDNSNIITKTRNSFNRKSFRFLVNQTNKNSDLSTSFSKCYNNNSRPKPLLKNSQIFSNNDSLNFSNAYYDTESNNESTFNNYNDVINKKQTKFNTQKNLANIDRDNNILINDDSNTEKSNKGIKRKKYILSVLTTPKYRLIRETQRTNTNLSLSSCALTSDLKSKPRNISAISLSGINLDLYYLQEKMKLVIDKISSNEQCSNECYNYLQYFFENNFYNELLKPFKNEENIKIMSNYIKFEIVCYFLCYNICSGDNFKKAEILLKSIFDILFNNFILYLCLVVSQCKNKNDNIIIVLNKIIKDNLNNDLLLNHGYNYNYYLDENKYINIISTNSKNINDYYNIIINNIYKKQHIRDINLLEYIININNQEINDELCEKNIPIFFMEINKYINEVNIDNLQNFFNIILCYKNKNEINIELNYNKNKNIDYNIIDNPKENKYLLPEIKDNKEYTLILDLEDTLIHSQRNFNFKNKLCNINKKLIIFRPYLFEFLSQMKSLYELILFSSNTPDYVDPIVKLIQKRQKFFDHILYRHHITLDDEGNNVKNLELIGRDLNKVIIIDDIARYFKLQKENGINIKPFYGNAKKDGMTLQILGNVLKKIRKDADSSGDIRLSLEKYREDLYPNVVDKTE